MVLGLVQVLGLSLGQELGEVLGLTQETMGAETWSGKGVEGGF